MRTIVWLRGKKVARTSGAVQRAIRILAQGIAALNKEARYNPMESRAVEEPHLGKIHKIFHVAWRIVRVKANGDVAESGDDRGTGIFLLKLDGHGEHSINGAIVTQSL